MNIQKERYELFDESFKCITTDVNRVYAFCEELKSITGILVGNQLGYMYEYLPRVYKGAIQQLEMQNMWC